jgi:CheY-like chemotaxis protein/two-component sensor histidine kinase
LILAQELAANPDGNLLQKQIEYATIIRSSGTDLLKLINDILDLSKIESGTVTVDIANWPLDELKPMLERTFRHVAEATKLSFAIDLREGLPATMATDPQRLQQILNNLLSNAFKFTEKGGVEFIAQVATAGWGSGHELLDRAEHVIAFSVVDTGIGIPVDKQQTIFEPFAQGDGSTSRKYGGTGLGLSICRELTRMLRGEIRLESEPGVGSVFTVYLPIGAPAPARRGAPGGFTNGRSDGESHPAPRPVGVTAALGAGWHVEAAQAVAEREPDVAEKTLLVVEDDPFQRQNIIDVLASLGAHTISVGTGEEALSLLEDHKVDCVVLDLGLPGLTGWQVIDHIRAHKALRAVPVVVYTARDLTRKEELKLGRATKTIVVKEVRSPERLKDEVTAILEGPRPASSAQAGSNGYDIDDSMLAGKKVLVVDDDIRNIFALTAMLERHAMEVISVDSGQEALDTLQARDDIDVALVDVMMPEMDGYQTMSRMRLMSSFRERPIIALTAKAMKGDREKCIDAGASDYIAKPVNTLELMSMLKSWLGP